MKASENCLALLRRFEGCRLTAYRCLAGVLTIGYGHTGKDVTEGMKITLEEAERLLRSDVDKATSALPYAELTQGQVDALTSFVFNVGAPRFHRSKLRRLVAENPDNRAIKAEFMRWVYVNKSVVSGLVVRRREEAALYFA